MGHRKPLPLDQLQLPDQQKMKQVMSALTDAGRAEFLDELYAAVGESASTKDVSPLQFVVDAWWASATFTRHPRFEAAVLAAQKSVASDKHYDAETLHEFLAPA